MKLPFAKVCIGVGDFSKGEACILAQIVGMRRLERGEPLGDATDHAECVCPVLRKLAIRANDAIKDDTERYAWATEMLPRLLNTAGDLELTRRRMFRCVDLAVRVYAPKRLRSLGFGAEADKLEALAPIVDRLSARNAAAADADAYAYAAAAAAAASAAADAYDAYAYADAAYADAYAASRELLTEALAVV